MPNLNRMNLRQIYATANATEPSLMTMFTGMYPHQHGYTSLGQRNGEKLVEEHDQGLFRDWGMFSPSDQFKHMMGSFQRGAIDHVDQPDPYCLSVPDLGTDNQVIHLMDVHDMQHVEGWKDWYTEYRPMVDEQEHRIKDISDAPGGKQLWKIRLKMVTPDGDKPIQDAGVLEAIYRNTAHRVDQWLGTLLDTDERIIVTSDHGECFTEHGISFTHIDLYDCVLKVPLATNFDVPLPQLCDHSDLLGIITGKQLVERDHTFALENTWQTRYRVTDRFGNYLIHSGKKENMVYDRPEWEGDMHLKDVLLHGFKNWKEKPPCLLQLHRHIIKNKQRKQKKQEAGNKIEIEGTEREEKKGKIARDMEEGGIHFRWDILRALTLGDIVDIGCWEGHLFGDAAVNVDVLSEEEIIERIDKPISMIPNFVQADAKNLPFDNNQFDTAVLGDILEHIDDPDAVLREASRVANIVVISVPNEHEWHESLKPFTNPHHKRYYTKQTFIQQLLAADLRIECFIRLDYHGWSFFIAVCTSTNIS